MSRKYSLKENNSFIEGIGWFAMFRVFTTEEFDKELGKLDNSEQRRVKSILEQLKEQGGAVGKPLSGLSFFKEKKFGGKRLYFLVYQEMLVVLVLAISDKKTQQATINKILVDIAEYQQYVFRILDKK